MYMSNCFYFNYVNACGKELGCLACSLLDRFLSCFHSLPFTTKIVGIIMINKHTLPPNAKISLSASLQDAGRKVPAHSCCSSELISENKLPTPIYTHIPYYIQHSVLNSLPADLFYSFNTIGNIQSICVPTSKLNRQALSSGRPQSDTESRVQQLMGVGKGMP